MEKDKSSAAQRVDALEEGIRNKKAVTNPEMAIASTKDMPRDPVGMLTQFKFIAYSFDRSDVLFPDFFAHFSDVNIHCPS